MLSLQYSHLTGTNLIDIIICCLQRVCSFQICQRRVSLVYERSPPCSTPRLRFYCEFSFTLSYFLGYGVFESYPTCLVVSAGSEGFLIFGFFFGPLVPCECYFPLRDSLGERSLGFSLAGLLFMLVI